jgi:hypothetical protein
MDAKLERINGVPVLCLKRSQWGGGKRQVFDLVLTEQQAKQIQIHTGADFA